MTAISPELLEQYRRTDYHVDLPDAPFVFRVDERSPPLADLLAGRKAGSAALITACNPYSQKASDAQNRAANERMKGELQAAGLEPIPARGVDRDGTWPAEAGFFVVGIARAAAEDLGRRYRQNAIVFAAEDALPRLVALR